MKGRNYFIPKTDREIIPCPVKYNKLNQTKLPDCRRDVAFKPVPNESDDGINSATSNAHMTSRAPNTNGGPGTICSTENI